MFIYISIYSIYIHIEHVYLYVVEEDVVVFGQFPIARIPEGRNHDTTGWQRVNIYRQTDR